MFDFCKWMWLVLIRLFLFKILRSIMSYISSFRPCLHSAQNSFKLFKNWHQRQFRSCNFDLNWFTLISSELNISLHLKEFGLNRKIHAGLLHRFRTALPSNLVQMWCSSCVGMKEKSVKLSTKAWPNSPGVAICMIGHGHKVHGLVSLCLKLLPSILEFFWFECCMYIRQKVSLAQEYWTIVQAGRHERGSWQARPGGILPMLSVRQIQQP